MLEKYRKLKVVHVTPSYKPSYNYGGSVTACHGYCSGLASLGHDVEVITTSLNGADELRVDYGKPYLVDGVIVWYFPVSIRKIYYSRSMCKQIVESIKSADFVHIHSVFTWPSYYARRTAQIYQKPWAITPHGALVRQYINRRNFVVKYIWIFLFDRMTILRSVFVHVTSDSEARQIRVLPFLKSNINIIYNGVDLDKANTYLTSNQYRDHIFVFCPFILFLGRVSPEKALERSILSLKYLPDVNFVIAGSGDDGYINKIKLLADAVGVLSRVFFVGHVESAYKYELLRSSELLLLTSYYENFGIVLLESLAMRRPVAATQHVGSIEYIQRAGAGLVVPDDPEKMGAELRTILHDKKVLNSMGDIGYKLVSLDFTWEKIANNLLNAYCGSINCN